MPLIIENISPAPRRDSEMHDYRIRMNDKVLIHFQHRRSEGLAKCLLQASRALTNYQDGWTPDE
jgi:hypothetical protein